MPRKKGAKATKAKATAKATATNRTNVTVNVGTRTRRSERSARAEGPSAPKAHVPAMYHPPVIIHNSTNQAENVAHAVRQVLGEAYGHIKSGAVQRHAVPAPVVDSIPAAVRSPSPTPSTWIESPPGWSKAYNLMYDGPTPHTPIPMKSMSPGKATTNVMRDSETSTIHDAFDKVSKDAPHLFPMIDSTGAIKVVNPKNGNYVLARGKKGQKILETYSFPSPK